MDQEILEVQDEPTLEDDSGSVVFSEFENEPADYKLLKQLLEQRKENLIKEQTSEEWTMNSSQIKLRENEDFLNEQTNTIHQLESKTRQLLQEAKNRDYLSSKIENEIKKVEKNITTLRNYYGSLKKSMEKCLESKNKLEKQYQQSLIDVDGALKEKNCKLADYVTKLGRLQKMYVNERNKCASLEKTNTIIQKEKEDEVGRLQIELLKLTDGNEVLRTKNDQLLEEIKQTLEDKNEIFQELKTCKEKFENLIESSKSDLDSINRSLSNANKQQIEDKKTIEQLKVELTDYNKSLNVQNEYVNELIKKNETIENAIAKLEQENKELKISVDDYKIELEITKDTINHDLTVAQNNCVEYEDSLNILRDDYNHVKQDYETAKDVISTLKKNMEEKQEHENRLEKLSAEMKTNITNLQKEKESGLSKIEDMTETQKNMEEKYSTIIANLQDSYDNVFIEQQNLKEEIESALRETEAIKKSTENEMNIIREETERKIKQIIDHSDMYKNEFEKIRQNEVTKRSKEISQLTETIKTMELQINELKASTQFLQNELYQKTHENAQLVDEKEKIRKPEKNLETFSSLSYSFKEPESDVVTENIQKEESKPTLKRANVNKIRDPLPWNDSWSDSSIENEYGRQACRPKLSEVGNRLVPPKRKILSTPLNEKDQGNNDNIFDTQPQASTSLFQPPPESKMTKKSRQHRKPLRMD